MSTAQEELKELRERRWEEQRERHARKELWYLQNDRQIRRWIFRAGLVSFIVALVMWSLVPAFVGLFLVWVATAD